jgi:hypothetical protein
VLLEVIGRMARRAETALDVVDLTRCLKRREWAKVENMIECCAAHWCGKGYGTNGEVCC